MAEQRDDKLGEAIEEAQRKAITDQQWTAHQATHDLLIETGRREWEQRWEAHDREHASMREALKTAIDAVDKERTMLALAHAKEHELEAEARDKAEIAVDHRLEGMNEVRGQLREQASTFARVESVASLTDRIIAIEKLDIKGEGRALGQGAVVAIIVGAVSFVGAILGIVIVVSNFVSAT